jgi:hypothetical protein
MRRLQSMLTLGVVLAVSAGLVAQTTDQHFAGRWEGQRQAEGRLDTMAFVFDVTAHGVTGTVFYNGQEFGKLDSVTIVGDTATFTLGDMSFTGVIDSKTGAMKVTAHFDGRDLWDVMVTKKEKSLGFVTSGATRRCGSCRTTPAPTVTRKNEH